MESFEALGLCIGRDSEQIAQALGVATITVQKWKQDPLASGSRNPVDIIKIAVNKAIAMGRRPAEALAPVTHLVDYFKDAAESADLSVQRSHADLMQEFSHLISEHAVAIRDGQVSPDERRRLEREIVHVREMLDEYEAAIKVEN